MTIRAAILDSQNKVINVVLLGYLSDVPGAIDALDASIGDTWDGSEFVKPAQDIAALKITKNLQINEWRSQANRSTFPYAGKLIACDDLSRSDIDAVAGSVAMNNAFPVGFPNAWKATDNTLIAIPDITTFKAMYNAMTLQGTLNFARSQELKTILASAQTAQEINSIKWEV